MGDNIHQFFRDFGSERSRAGFKIAYACAALISQGMPRMYAVALAASDSGVSKRKVQDYLKVIETFDEGELGQFEAAGLGITHLAACVYSGYPREAVTWAIGRAIEKNGKPATVDEIKLKWIYEREPTEPESPASSRPFWAGGIDKIIVLLPDTGKRLQAGRLWNDLGALLWPEGGL